MKLLCVKCEIELRCFKNDVMVIEYAGGDDPYPYRIWHADEWKCPSCDFKVVAEFGQQPLAEHWEEKFPRYLAETENHPELRRNDYERVRERIA